MKGLFVFTVFLTLKASGAFENGFLSVFTDGVDDLIEQSLDKVETYENVKFNYTISCNSSMELVNRGRNGQNFSSKPSKMSVKLLMNNPAIARMEERGPRRNLKLNCTNDTEKIIQLSAGHLGITKMTLEVTLKDSEVISQDVEIRIKRKMTLFDVVTFYILGPLVLLNKCAFGAKIEIQTLVHIFTQPVALCLCLITQFMVMPLLAFIYATIFSLNQAMALALFVAATCPGGGGGYVISYLIGGDVTLAISASLVSTLVAMGAMPGIIGLYAYFMKVPDTIAIPYLKMIMILCVIAVPISTGMFINKQWPNFAKKFVKIIKPLSLFLIFCGFAYLAVTSKYIIYGPSIGWALAFLLPSSGFLLAISIARCCRQTWPFAKAISLESGMKNTVLGIAVIELTYPQPEADLSSILIIMVTLGHTSLAMFWYFSHLIKRKCQSKYLKKSSITLSSVWQFEKQLSKLCAAAHWCAVTG